MRSIVFKDAAFDEFTEWAAQDKKIFQRIAKLIEETRRNPFQGSGKTEPLRFQLKGCWSRRITEEHRLVYKATDGAIEIISCKYHYR